MTNTATNTAMVWTLVALAALAIVIVAAIVSRRRARLRSADLRRKFGPEYDHAVEELGTPAKAEHELAARTRRVEHIRFRELTDAERARFASTWSRIQSQFIDDPVGAAVDANDLIKDVMRARGYPMDDFEQRVADLSVDHAEVVQHYRAARNLSESSRHGQVNTEDLRQAVVHFRTLFADLLQVPGSAARPLREIHA
jgi:hypothetical protein